MSLDRGAATAILRRLGWRIRTTGEFRQAVVHFQRGWALGPGLTVDGRVGPKTSAALRQSDQARAAGKGTASPHFSFAEFACKCGGRYSECARIWVISDLLKSLEDIRRNSYPAGMSILSGCRCTGHNRDVKGAKSSQHLYGGAADIEPKVSDQKIASLGVVAGIGYNPHHLVRHVDRRDRSGHNTTRSSLTHPMRWRYSN